jgi:hypothetical protein
LEVAERELAGAYHGDDALGGTAVGDALVNVWCYADNGLRPTIGRDGAEWRTDIELGHLIAGMDAVVELALALDDEKSFAPAQL